MRAARIDKRDFIAVAPGFFRRVNCESVSWLETFPLLITSHHLFDDEKQISGGTMPVRFIVFGVMILAAAPLAAQEQQKPSVTDQQRNSVSDEKAAEIRALIEKARIRQQGVDRQNENLWARWTYAVCIGCGPASGKIRIVRTNPLRVLIGIPAAEDDARSERGKRQV